MSFVCSFCSKKLSSKSNLNQHLWCIHNVNYDGKRKMVKCNQQGCSSKFKTKGELNIHLWHTHDINYNGKKKMIKCNQQGCKFESKTKSDLNRHLWCIHNVNYDGKRKMVKCMKKDCKFESKTNGDLNQHLWQVHDVNYNGKMKIFKCVQQDCKFESKTKSDLNQHLWKAHNINYNGKKKMIKCNQQGCSSEFKTKSDLNQHLWHTHNINYNGKRKIFYCNQQGCTYKSKTKSHLTSHLENVHDVGNLECDFCIGRCFKLKAYKDHNNVSSKICRKCYKKCTGYKCRAEEQMVKMLKDTPQISPFIVLVDKIVKHDLCKTRRRPDILISSGYLHIIIEADEKQHKNYSIECESGRMDEIIDEFKEGKVIFIRWNPDYYKSTNKDSRKERLEKLRQLVLNIINGKKQIREHIKVIYMYYDVDNPVITTRFSKEIIH